MLIHHRLNVRKRALVAIVLASIIFFIFPVMVFANTDNGELNFSVEPIFPESQIAETTNYFDLNLKEGVEESLGLSLINLTTEEIEIKISSYTAYTNVNGVVEYARENDDVNPTLPYELGELLDDIEIVTLAPGERKVVYTTLTMPEDRFEGLLAGGLRIQEIEDENRTEATGINIRNAFSYVIGVVVSNERTSITPDLELLNVFEDQLNYRNVISATIQNYTSTFVNQLEVKAEVRLEGGDEVLYEAHKSGMQMAPNSHFHFPISLEGDRFRAGDYVLSMTANSGEHEWSWEYQFTIDQQSARQLNRDDVSIDTSINWLMVVIASLFTLLLIIIIYLIYRQRKILKSQEISQQSIVSQSNELDKKE